MKIRIDLLISVLVILYLCLSPISYAGVDEGLAAHKKGDYQTALKEIRPLAEEGNRSAQHILAVMYYKGDGVKQDNITAFKWFEKAAKQGHANAQYNLAIFYADGLVVKQNYFTAFEWHEKAANQGHAIAQFNLGQMYYRGRGVRQSLEKAKEWLGKACDNKFQWGCDAYAEINMDQNK